MLGGLLVRRQRWSLSLPAKILLVLAVIGCIWMLKQHLQPFLAVSEPVPAEILVVEGWSPPYAMKEAAEKFRTGGYKRILVTRAIYDTYDQEALNPTSADYIVRLLVRNGAPKDRIDAVYSSSVRKDRTFHTALSVKRWLSQHGLSVKGLDVATMGCHARRSRLLYEKAFGDGVKIGIVPLEDVQYDPARWWVSSEGVREVLDETIAYGYARLLFRPSEADLSP
jgi:hypothetical protein